MNDNIIKIQKEEKEENKDNILKASFDAITEALPELEGVDGISTLLALPEEQFSILAPAILLEIDKSLNNISDKMLLVRSLNASGLKAEDLTAAFSEITELIDEKLTTIPRIKRDFVKRIIGMLCNAVVDTEGIAKKTIQVPIELCHKDAKIPTYAHLTDAGADIYSPEDFTINPGETKLIKTGLKVAVPVGYELQIRARSGISLKTKLILGNGIGTIDPSYREELGIILENIEPKITNIDYDFNEKGEIQIKSIEHGRSFSFSKGDRIAQLVLNEVPKAIFYEVEKVEGIGEDRKGGFGSSGLK